MLLADIMGTKPRTITCYSLIGMAVKYIYDANEQTFLELGHPWEEMMEDFLPGRFRDAVRLTHPEISRPDLLLKNFLRDLGNFAKELTISQVRFIVKFVTRLRYNLQDHMKSLHAYFVVNLEMQLL